MSAGGAVAYVALSAIALGGWAVLGYGGRKAWEWAIRHHERRR